MSLLVRLWSSKQFWVFFICFIVIGSIVGGIIGLIGSTGFFDSKSIDKKYCYLFNTRSLINKYDGVMCADNLNDAKKVIEYYDQLLMFHKDTTIGLELPNATTLPRFINVDIIDYLDDSSIVKIRAEWTSKYKPNKNKKVTGYVPIFTLFDTLPKDTTNK